MSRLTGTLAGSILLASEWPRASAAVLAAAIIGLGASGYFANSYVLYSRLVAEQDLTIRRIASANMDLQKALDRMRDETAQTLQQLRAENSVLQLRVSELEQYQFSLQSANPRATKRRGNRQTPPRQAPVETVSVAPVTGSSGMPRPAVQASPAAQVTLEQPTNFSAPSWVPDYFSNESGSLTGSLRRGRGRAGTL
jgi:hypothetical protein